MIVTSSDEGVQLPFVIVQRNITEVPTGKPVIVDTGDPGLVIVAVPDITLHAPLPVTGTFPANAAVVVLHTC